MYSNLQQLVDGRRTRAGGSACSNGMQYIHPLFVKRAKMANGLQGRQLAYLAKVPVLHCNRQRLGFRLASLTPQSAT